MYGLPYTAMRMEQEFIYPKKRRKRRKRKRKDWKGLSSELCGIPGVSIKKTFNIRNGLSSVFSLILSVLILSNIHIAVTSALWQCTRGFNFSLSCKKIQVNWGQIVFLKIQGLGRLGGNGYSKRLFALRRFWDWWTETNIFTFYVINLPEHRNHFTFKP